MIHQKKCFFFFFNASIVSLIFRSQDTGLKEKQPASHTQKNLCLVSLRCVQVSVTPRTVAHQAPLSMEFSREEYESGLPFPSPGNFPGPGIEPRSLTLQVHSLPSQPLGKPYVYIYVCVCVCMYVQLIYNIMLMSTVQQGDSFIYIYIHTLLFNIFVHYGLSEDIEQSSLCYTVGSCLSILYLIVCIC